MYYRCGQLELIHLQDCHVAYPEHNHACTFTVGMVLAGGVMLEHRRQTCRILPGQMFWIAPYEAHAITPVSAYDMLSLSVHTDLMQQEHMPTVVGVLQQALSCVFKHDHLQAACIERFRQTLEEICAWQQVHLHTPELLLEMKHLQQSAEDAETGLERLAAQVGVSKYHLIRKFKRECGLTPHQFQIQGKVRKAQRLLEQNGSIAGVAQDAGFYDQSHLTRHFKYQLGLTPCAYRQSCMELKWPAAVSTAQA